MPVSKNRQFAKIANDVNTSGTLTAAAISSDVTLGGATIYASRSNLPSSGNTAGDQAFTTDANRLYIWNGSGWYNVALLNVAPAISSVTDSDNGTTPFALSTTGAVTTITITAADSDGDPITYSATSDSDFSGLATISQDSSVFTITPFSLDSATTSSGTITFTATDGINVASSGIQTFTLNFVSAYWDETALSIGTSSTNSLANSTFVDRSINAHTVTTAGSPVQTAFHPYLDNWSAEAAGTSSITTPNSTDFGLGTGDWTFEAWINPTSNPTNGPGTLIDLRSAPLAHGTAIRIWNDLALSFYDGPGGVERKTTTGAITLNQWQHIAIVKNSGTVTFYIDGTADSNTYSSSSDLGTTWVAQILQNRSTGYGYYGYVSNMRLVKGTAVYTSNFTPSTENLTAISGTSLLCFQNNRFIDNSSSAHTLSISAGTPKVSAFNPFGQGSEYAIGANKGSVYFDGSSILTNTTANMSLSNLNDWTVEFWYYTSSTSGTQVVVAGDGTTIGAFELYFSNGSMNIGGAGTAVYLTIASSYLPLNAWTHIAIVHSIGGTAVAYVNGVAADSGAWNVNNSSTGFNVAGYTSLYKYTGYVSDVRISKSTGVYTSTFTPPTSSVDNTNADLYLPMDNAGIFDKTGNNTLTLGGNTATSTTQTKYADTSIYFDGTGDTAYVSGGASPKFNIGGITQWTAEFWCNTTASGHQRLLTFHGPANWGLIKPLAQTTGIEWNQFGVSVGFTSGPGTLPANTWTHVALVRNGSTITCYLNGTSAGSTTSIPTSGNYEVWIGSSTGTYARSDTNGYFEDIQFLSGVAKYTANFTPPTQTQGRNYQAES